MTEAQSCAALPRIPEGIRRLVDRVYIVAIVLGVSAPLWMVPLSLRFGALVVALALPLLLLIMLVHVVVVDLGSLEHSDSYADRVGQRLGRPRAVAGARMWLFASSAIWVAWTLLAGLDPRVADPQDAARPLFGDRTDFGTPIVVVLVVGAPLLVLFAVDWGRRLGRR
jgi:hypothetical protein